MEIGVGGSLVGEFEALERPEQLDLAQEAHQHENDVLGLLRQLLPPGMRVSASFRLAEAPQLPPESDYGNVEYKLKLVGKRADRKRRLATQLHFRLSEGGGRMFYQLGWNDPGRPIGTPAEEMAETLATVQELAASLGAEACLLALGRCDPRGPEQAARQLHLRLSGVAPQGQAHWVASVCVRRRPRTAVEPGAREDILVCVIGDEGVGKSSLVGVLSTGVLDDGDGGARLELLRHRHEVEAGRTSSICRQILGFRADGTPASADRDTYAQASAAAGDKSWAQVAANSCKLVTFLDLAGHPTYRRTTSFGLVSQQPDYSMLVVSAAAAASGNCISETTQEHLKLCAALKIPLFVVVTKTDLCDAGADTHAEAATSGEPPNEFPEAEGDDDAFDFDDDDADDGDDDADAGDAVTGSANALDFLEPHPMFDDCGGAAFVEDFDGGVENGEDTEGGEGSVDTASPAIQRALDQVREALRSAAFQDIVVVDTAQRLEQVVAQHRTRGSPNDADSGVDSDEDGDDDDEAAVGALVHEMSRQLLLDDEDSAGVMVPPVRPSPPVRPEVSAVSAASAQEPSLAAGEYPSAAPRGIPVFLTSSVRGGLGLRLLRDWLFRCPPQLDWSPLRPPSQEQGQQQQHHQQQVVRVAAPPHARLAEFSVAECFWEVDQAGGLVCGGLLHQARLGVGDSVWFGPVACCAACERQEEAELAGVAGDGLVVANDGSNQTSATPNSESASSTTTTPETVSIYAADASGTSLPPPRPQGACARCTGPLQWFHLARIASMQLHHLPVEAIVAGQSAAVALRFVGDWVPLLLRSDPQAAEMDPSQFTRSEDVVDDDVVPAASPEIITAASPEEDYFAASISRRRRRALRGGKGLVILGVQMPAAEAPSRADPEDKQQQSQPQPQPQQPQTHPPQPEQVQMQEQQDQQQHSSPPIQPVQQPLQSPQPRQSPQLPAAEILRYLEWRRYPSVCWGFDAQLTVLSAPACTFPEGIWRPLIYCRSLRRVATLVAMLPRPPPRLDVGAQVVCRFSFLPVNGPEWIGLRSKVVVTEDGSTVRMEGRVVRLWPFEGDQPRLPAGAASRKVSRAMLAASAAVDASADASFSPTIAPAPMPSDWAVAAAALPGITEAAQTQDEAEFGGGSLAASASFQGPRCLSLGASTSCVYCNPMHPAVLGALQRRLEEEAASGPAAPEHDETPPPPPSSSSSCDAEAAAECPLSFQRSLELLADPIKLGGGDGPDLLLRGGGGDTGSPAEVAVAEHWCSVARAQVSLGPNGEILAAPGGGGNGAGDPELDEDAVGPFPFVVIGSRGMRKRNSHRSLPALVQGARGSQPS